MSDLLHGIGNQVSRFWEHGLHFLLGCASACVLGFLLLLGGRYFGYQTASDMLDKYGLILLLGTVLFVSLAAARWRESRPKKELFLVPQEEQCIWGHAKQKSGEIFTSFNISMDVTNTAATSYHLSKPRIIRPFRARWHEQVTGVLMTRNPAYPADNTYSQSFPIRPHARSHSSGVIALKGAFCSPGKRLNFTLLVLDHRGRRHRIRFKGVHASNDKAV